MTVLYDKDTIESILLLFSLGFFRLEEIAEINNVSLIYVNEIIDDFILGIS